MHPGPDLGFKVTPSTLSGFFVMLFQSSLVARALGFP